MKIKTIFLKIGYILSFIFPYKYSALIRYSYRILYTSWISREFLSFGKDTYIYPHLRSLLGGKYISIGDNCTIGKNVVLTAWDQYENKKYLPSITVGDNSSIGDDSHITAINKIIIGKNVLFGKKVLITDNAHGSSSFELLKVAPSKRSLYSKGPVIIDDNVWIGEKVSIMPGVHIGFGSIIGSNSVVTRNIPPYSVAAGIPARVIKNLSPNID